MLPTITNKVILIIIVMLTLLSCNKKCFDAEPTITVRFFTDRDTDTLPMFDHVIALEGIKDFQFNKNRFIPLSLMTDSTIVIFKKDTIVDTVAFHYTRKLQEKKNSSDYCITLERGRVTSTFHDFCYEFELNTGPGVQNCTDNAFELYLQRSVVIYIS